MLNGYEGHEPATLQRQSELLRSSRGVAEFELLFLQLEVDVDVHLAVVAAAILVS